MNNKIYSGNFETAEQNSSYHNKIIIYIKKVKKVKYADLYSALSGSASNALPLPVSRR